MPRIIPLYHMLPVVSQFIIHHRNLSWQSTLQVVIRVQKSTAIREGIKRSGEDIRDVFQLSTIKKKAWYGASAAQEVRQA